jgi:hypothetical protein
VDGQDDLGQSDSAHGRRAFLKRMAAFAFAAPVISSFVLDSDAFAGGRNQHGKTPPNQYGQNQTVQVPPNQYGQNQTGQPPINVYQPNQTVKPPPNQYGQNQTQEPCPPPDKHGQNQNKGNKSQGRW